MSRGRVVAGLLASVSAIALISAASAADMPLKARPPSTFAPNLSWTGFYGGFHAGVGVLADPASATMQRFTGADLVPHPLQSAEFSNTAFPFAGAQLGYNRQFGQWVAGLEADISVGPRRQFGATLSEGPITYTVIGHGGFDWFGTLRARIGYLIAPSLLTYITGGLAYGGGSDFKQIADGPGPIGTFVFSNSSGTQIGWVVGGGFEYLLDRKWSAKLEYQYVDLSDELSGSTLIQFNPGKNGNKGLFNVHAEDTAHTVRMGLNYRFWQ